MQEQIINNLQFKSWRQMYASEQCGYKEIRKSEVIRNPVNAVDPVFNLCN